MLKKWAWLIAFLILAGTSPLQAEDTSTWDKFVQGIGKSVYFAAFPTATYKGARFRTITRAPGGTEVVFEVYGLSAFDDSDLWTEVIITVKDFSISNLRWGRNNAFLMQPGETMGSLASFLADLNKQLQENPKPLSTVRLTWVINNQCQYSTGIQVRFFDITNNLTWPADGKVFLLAPGVSNEISIETHGGAKVCIGAEPNVASPDSHWGAGLNNNYPCDDCCYIAADSKVTWSLACN